MMDTKTKLNTGDHSGRADDLRSDSRSFSFDSVSDIFPIMTMTKNIWLNPVLHNEDSEGSHFEKAQSHRKEEWYELFYDLVFVASAIQMGNLLKYHIDWDNIYTMMVLFMVMRATWDQLMLYQNRYDTKDLLHHTFYLMESMTAFVMCMSLSMNEDHRWDIAINMRPFAIAGAVARIAQTIMYSQILSQKGTHHLYIRAVTIAQRVSAIILICAAIFAPLHGFEYSYYFSAALIVERPLVHIFVYFAFPKGTTTAHRVPQHTMHLIHRQGTFILLILGEAIIQLVQSEHGQSFQDYVKSLMGFAIVFNIGDTYYQQQVAGLKNDVKFRPNYMWSYLHLLLSLLMLYFAVGLKLTFNRDDSNRSFLDEKFMCGSAAGALGVIFILRLMHKGIRYKGKKVRRLSYTFRFGAAALCGIIPFWSFNSTATIAYLFLITTIIVLQDLFSHRGKQTNEHGGGADRDLAGGAALDPLISEPLSDDFGRSEFIKDRQKNMSQNDYDEINFGFPEKSNDDYSMPNNMMDV